MALKPQDIVVCLKLAVWPDEPWTYETLALSLGPSASETHAAMQRLREARLLDSTQRRPLKRNFLEMLTGGIKYFYAVKTQGQITGIPTAYAAAPLKGHLLDLGGGFPPPVWPWPDGEIYGLEITPLYRTVPWAAQQDPQLYELLALVDAIRMHTPRVSRLAGDLLHARIEELSHNWRSTQFTGARNS
jgi:predicted transcriptional regulator